MPKLSTLPAKDIDFSLGTEENLGVSRNLTEGLTKFARRFRDPLATPEKFYEYKKLSQQRQAKLKGKAGWFLGAPTENGTRRRDEIEPRDLITLDIDYATPKWARDFIHGKILPDYCLLGHTTRSHTPESPRFRIAIPLKTKLPADRYQAACRIVAKLLDPKLEVVDKVSARTAQMMYFPTVSKDMVEHYVFHTQDGELLDWESIVEEWEGENGSSDDFTKLPRFPGEHELRDTTEKAEDPLEKTGAVGTFCRAYSITELIDGKEGEDEAILGEVYEGDDYHQGVITRATFLGGTSANGAVVYEDVFMYSHHGSDPAQDQTLNAYDLVRYHKFDAGADDPDAPMSQRPSVKKMNEWMKDLPGYKAQLTSEKFDLDYMFDDDDDMSWARTEGGDDDEFDQEAFDEEAADLIGVKTDSLTSGGIARYTRQAADKPPTDWVASQLELTQDGTIKSTLHNIATIITNDPRFFRKIARDQFSERIMLLADVKTKGKTIPDITCTNKQIGMPWRDRFSIVIRAVCEAPNGKGKPGYGIKVSDRDLIGGIMLAAEQNAYHPVKELIEKWREMGKPARNVIDGWCQRHLGADNDDYTNMAFRLWLIAHIARIEKPGHKFDYAPIFEGPQGIGKSTMIKCLVGEEFFGEIDVDLKSRREVAEQIAGKWCCELPELSSLHKSDHNDAKHFMRRTDDDVREAYGKNVEPKPRQTVFAGTTNDSKYLRDPTGNRSYWPIYCRVKSIDFLAILKEREELWRQVVWEYDQMRQRQPEGDLPLTLKGPALEHAKRLQERARTTEMWEEWLLDVIDWAERPVRLGNLAVEMGWDLLDLPKDLNEDSLVRRVAFTQGQAAEKALGLPRDGAFTNPTQHRAWNDLLRGLEERGFTKDRVRVAGKVNRWNILPVVSDEDLRRGFTFTGEAKPTLNDGPREPEDLI